MFGPRSSAGHWPTFSISNIMYNLNKKRGGSGWVKRARQQGLASSGREETGKSLRGRRLIHEKAKKQARRVMMNHDNDDVKQRLKIEVLHFHDEYISLCWC